MSPHKRYSFLPRHIKGYLWITFLVTVFLLAVLSENGVPVLRLLSGSRRFSLVQGGQQPVTLQPANGLPDPPRSHSQDPIAGGKTEEETGLSTPLGLDPKDVVIVVKTGASSIWRRMPMHMSTTLGNPKLTPNVIYYSDSEDNISGNPVIDVLANVSASLKASPDFVLYNRVKEIRTDNLYLESASMEGDSYLPGGWRLDKYKFLPMFAHVAATQPGKKWYIYMEDDNYFFWETLYAWLATLDHTSPIVVGSPAFRLGEDFAHGGSGFAISGKALAATFGADSQLADRYESYAREQCCGDQVLSHAMREMGVERYRGLDGGSWAALQALPTWRIGFGDWNWCSPIMNIHKVHQADISRLHVFEQEFKRKATGTDSHMRYRDIFIGLAKSQLMKSDTRSEWDNYAAAKTLSSSADTAAAASEEETKTNKPTPSQLSSRPWYSREACHKACKDWQQCLSWKYADDSCSLDHTAALGQRIDAGIRMESGWMLERIAKLEDKSCEAPAF